ncbi:MAG: type II secretion system minor pseudopilin GspK [Pseudomonadota bacterium]
MNFPRAKAPGHRKTAPASQTGVALVIAMLVFAIAAALLVRMQRDFDLNYRRAANAFVAEQSWSYLRGAEELAFVALRLDYEADTAAELTRDDLSEFWAQPSTPYPLDEGGWLMGELTDLQGRFNVNSLSAPPLTGQGTAAYDAPKATFIRLLQALEGVQVDEFEAVRITESVADWLDQDDEPRLNGAESSFYVSQTPSYRPGNGPMTSASELRAVANMRPEVYLALRPHVTVWPLDGSGINIHTATLPVLRSMNLDGSLRPLSSEAGQSLLEARAEGGFENLEEVLQLPAFAGAQEDERARMNALLTEASSFFLLTSRVEIADREQRMYSVLRRQARNINVLQRENASLYDLASAPPLPTSEPAP